MSACTCPGRRCQKILPGQIRWFWRALSRPSELCESPGYDAPARWSATSQVICLRCLRRWRTKARYAEQLPEPSAEEWKNIRGQVPLVKKLQDARQRAADRPANELAVPAAARQQTDYKMRAAGEA